MLEPAQKQDLVYFMGDDNKITLDNPHQDASNVASSVPSHSAADSDKPQGAVNQETGEINWDCPCLKAALAPPCGDTFRAAFSCFVSSQTDPKGAECLEQFSKMQDCYRAHPEIYMKDDDDEGKNDASQLHSVEEQAADNIVRSIEETNQ